MKLKNKFSKRFIYFFVTLGILVFFTGGVYAIASSGANSGHPASDIDFSSGITSQLKIYPFGSTTGPYFFVEQNNGGANYIQIGNYNAGFQPLLLDGNPLILQMRSSGKVGIGTTTPSEKLEVNGNIKWGSSTLSTDQKGSIELGDSTSSGNSPYIDFHYGKGATQDYNVRLMNDADGQLKLEGNFVASGSISAGSFLYTSSDKNLKTDIKPLQDSLQKVLELQGVSFNWKSTGQPSIGLIAQDVEKVFPEIVATDSKTGLKSVAYENLIAPLIESVKEQQKEINNLQEQINELKNKCS